MKSAILVDQRSCVLKFNPMKLSASFKSILLALSLGLAPLLLADHVHLESDQGWAENCLVCHQANDDGQAAEFSHAVVQVIPKPRLSFGVVNPSKTPFHKYSHSRAPPIS